jgi:hypothetical protein
MGGARARIESPDGQGRAEQSASGVVVNFMAYQADHAMAHEELKVIDAAWKAKKCK